MLQNQPRSIGFYCSICGNWIMHVGNLYQFKVDNKCCLETAQEFLKMEIEANSQLLPAVDWDVELKNL